MSLAAEKDKFMADWYERKGYKPIFSDKEYITFYKSLKNENNKNRISMEIILKCGDKLNIPDGCKAEIRDGIITIESEVKEFKDGDILTSNTMDCVMIYRNRGRRIHPEAAYYHCYASREHLRVSDDDSDSFCGNVNSFHLATEEGKQFLFKKMAEQNLRWNAEEKKIEKIRWKAEKGGYYYFINSIYNVTAVYDRRDSIDDKQFLSYNYFKTKEQAEKAAELVKYTLKKFHEEHGNNK